MHPFAQTNIQLLNQLRRQGYADSDLASVVAAYALAIRLFTGRFRASGKTFIAHLVGTASILGWLQVPARLLAAGLLHAVYLTGDFGDGGAGISTVKRDQVRQVVGEEVEESIARYTALRWSGETILALSGCLGSLAPADREVLLLRLANELEEYLDLGILYCGDQKRRQLDYLGRTGQLMVRMAGFLGFPTLASALAQAFQEAANAEIPAVLRGTDSPNHSFLLAPQSYQRLMETVSRRLARVGSPECQTTRPPESSP